jgi:hypothetical protein
VQIEWCKEDRNNRRMVVSLLETIQETIGDDPQEKIVSKKPGCCDTRDDGDDRDDKTLLSSVELKEKLKEEKEKEESRRVGQKTVSIVSSSPSDPQALTFGETIPKRDRLRSSPVLEPIYCATCGEDLTGKSQITKNGKVYCAKPGCGYPAREEPADPTCCSCGKALPGGRGAAQNGDGSFICSRCLQNN